LDPNITPSDPLAPPTDKQSSLTSAVVAPVKVQ
ncbi:hypothetical protein CAL7102_01034, partial [Dulcicalothrix desertica PCC 7102]